MQTVSCQEAHVGGAQDYSRYRCMLGNQLMDVCIVQIQCVNIMCYVFAVIHQLDLLLVTTSA